MDTALVPVSQTEKWITTEPEFYPPSRMLPIEHILACQFGRVRNVNSQVDNQKTDVVE